MIVRHCKIFTRNMEQDQENDKALRWREWTVLRFWGRDIMKHTQECVRAVDDVVFEKTGIEEWEIRGDDSVDEAEAPD